VHSTIDFCAFVVQFKRRDVPKCGDVAEIESEQFKQNRKDTASGLICREYLTLRRGGIEVESTFNHIDHLCGYV